MLYLHLLLTTHPAGADLRGRSGWPLAAQRHSPFVARRALQLPDCASRWPRQHWPIFEQCNPSYFSLKRFGTFGENWHFPFDEFSDCASHRPRKHWTFKSGGCLNFPIRPYWVYWVIFRGQKPSPDYTSCCVRQDWPILFRSRKVFSLFFVCHVGQTDDR